MGTETTVVTNFEPSMPAILSEDGTKLTLHLSKCNPYIRHKGVEYRVDTPTDRLGLATIDDKTVAFLNKKGEIIVNVGKMPKLKIVQVTYFVEAGTDKSPFWRGELVTLFDVKRDARGYLSFGDDVSIGTCEGRVTLCIPPYRPGENYRYPLKTSASGDETTSPSQTGSPQSAEANDAPAVHDGPTSEIEPDPPQAQERKPDVRP